MFNGSRSHKVRGYFCHSCSQFVNFVIRKFLIQHLRDDSNDLPINSSFTRWHKSWVSLLSSSFHVDIGSLFLSVSSSRQNTIGNGCSSVTMMTLVDHKTVTWEVCSGNSLSISPHQPQNFWFGLSNLSNTWSVSKVKCCNLASNSVQYIDNCPVICTS